jgi:peptide deformylase
MYTTFVLEKMMSALKILPFSHPDLKKRTALFVFDAHSHERIIDPLIQLLYRLRVWGVAAPEVGIAARLFVMDVSEERDEPLCCINPIIIEQQGQIISEEDSLSLPNVGIAVPRAKEIMLRHQDETALEQTITLEGLPAILVQQKIDILNGISILDHLSPLKRDRLLKKIKKNGHAEACGHGCDHHHH